MAWFRSTVRTRMLLFLRDCLQIRSRNARCFRPALTAHRDPSEPFRPICLEKVRFSGCSAWESLFWACWGCGGYRQSNSSANLGDPRFTVILDSRPGGPRCFPRALRMVCAWRAFFWPPDLPAGFRAFLFLGKFCELQVLVSLLQFLGLRRIRDCQGLSLGVGRAAVSCPAQFFAAKLEHVLGNVLFELKVLERLGRGVVFAQSLVFEDLDAPFDFHQVEQLGLAHEVELRRADPRAPVPWSGHLFPKRTAAAAPKTGFCASSSPFAWARTGFSARRGANLASSPLRGASSVEPL